MNRREFFRRAAMIAAGVVAADQLELLERLGHRKVFALGAPREICHMEFISVRTDWQPLVWRRLNEGVQPSRPRFSAIRRDFPTT